MSLPTAITQTLPAKELRLIDAYWRAANYLSVGQVYLLDNPLLREPLRPEHVKPRLLGHFGTVPGLNLIYVHLNRAIRQRDLDAIYITGPGHGGPAVVANAWLEGTGVLEVEGDEVALREGHAVFVPAGATHRFVGYEQLSVLVIFEKGQPA